MEERSEVRAAKIMISTHCCQRQRVSHADASNGLWQSYMAWATAY